MGKILGREPAVFVSTVVGAVCALVVLVPMNTGLSAAIVAVVMAAGGLATAMLVARDGLLPAILGFAKAGMALFVVLGWHISDVEQGLAIGALEAVFAVFVRQNVVAQIPPGGAEGVVPPARAGTL